MNNRVSTSRLPRRKCLTSTVPFGISQSPLANTLMFWPFGRPIHRSLEALSDQNAAFGAYGIRLKSGGAPADAVLMQPVADSS